MLVQRWKFATGTSRETSSGRIDSVYGFNLSDEEIPRSLAAPKSSREWFAVCIKSISDKAALLKCLFSSPGMSFAPLGAHRFHRLAFTDLDAGLTQNLPNFLMLAACGQFGFMIEIFRP